jgi:hypothetical protein
MPFLSRAPRLERTEIFGEVVRFRVAQRLRDFAFRTVRRTRRRKHVYVIATWLAQVSVNPNSTGMPGGAFVQQLLGWLSQLALWGSLASILIGAALYGISQNTGNYAGGYRGKQLAAAGAVGAVLAGLAPTAVNLLFRAAGA